MSTDKDLVGEFDAMIWAERFVAAVERNPHIATDEGAMTAWFATAIMSGFDRASAIAKKAVAA